MITMIYKNKGSHMDLEKYRGIFLTVIVSKVFERIIQSRMQPKLDKISKFQAGSRNGKGPPDNLFLLRSCIDYSKYMNKPLFITTYDFRQAFDSLWIQDCILVLQRLGVDNYLLQLIYELNRKTIVQVKTPYGLTEPAEVSDIVKQGGILGSPLCSAATAEYCEQNKGITMGDVRIATLAYVDDLIDVNDSGDNTTLAHNNAQTFSKKKKLEYTPDKCNIMLVNGKKSDVIPELFIEETKVKEVHAVVCLGDVFNSKGNNDDLVNDRIKRGTASMISIHGFMREVQRGIHTVSVFLLLHNAIFMAGLIFNAQAWSNLTDKNLERITTIQLKFLKKIMTAKQATSNSFVFLEMGILPVKYELHKRQLSFLHHIIHLSEDDPVRKVWKYQTSLPDHNNWWSGVKKLMSDYAINMTEQQIQETSKEAFKQRVKKAVKKVAFEDLKRESKSKEKTNKIEYSEFEPQKYMTGLYHNHSKIIFRCRSKTLNIKEHMQYKYKENMHCRWCGISEETLSHVVNCGFDGDTLENVDEIVYGSNMQNMREVARRVEDFLERIEV